MRPVRTSLLLLALGVAACRTEPAPGTTADSTAAADTSAPVVPVRASANLEARSGSSVAGTVSFTQEPTGVRVVGNFSGLTPGAKHGFHVHQFGDCSAPDASSAGEHFNPAGHPHGDQSAAAGARHVGDLGNLTADAQGNATIDLTDAMLMLHGANQIVGKAVVVHAKADDFGQPSGNAGGRIACGVITSAVGTAGAPLTPADHQHTGEDAAAHGAAPTAAGTGAAATAPATGSATSTAPATGQAPTIDTIRTRQ